MTNNNLTPQHRFEATDDQEQAVVSELATLVMEAGTSKAQLTSAAFISATALEKALTAIYEHSTQKTDYHVLTINLAQQIIQHIQQIAHSAPEIARDLLKSARTHTLFVEPDPTYKEKLSFVSMFSYQPKTANNAAEKMLIEAWQILQEQEGMRRSFF